MELLHPNCMNLIIIPFGHLIPNTIIGRYSKFQETARHVPKIPGTIVNNFEDELTVFPGRVQLYVDRHSRFLHLSRIAEGATKLYSVESNNIPSAHFGHELLKVVFLQPGLVQPDGLHARSSLVLTELYCVRQEDNIAEVPALKYVVVVLSDLLDKVVVAHRKFQLLRFGRLVADVEMGARTRTVDFEGAFGVISEAEHDHAQRLLHESNYPADVLDLKPQAHHELAISRPFVQGFRQLQVVCLRVEIVDHHTFRNAFGLEPLRRLRHHPEPIPVKLEGDFVVGCFGCR